MKREHVKAYENETICQLRATFMWANFAKSSCLWNALLRLHQTFL